jgi:hypothetical protein
VCARPNKAIVEIEGRGLLFFAVLRMTATSALRRRGVYSQVAGLVQRAG